MKTTKILLTSMLALSLFACSDDDDDDDDEVASSSSSSVEETASNSVFVFGSDYTSGELRYIVGDSALSSESLEFYQDSKVIAAGGALYVLERYGADNVSLIDVESFGSDSAVVWQTSLDDASNPSDLVAYDETSVWVSLEGNGDILQLSTEDGGKVKDISTDDFISEGGTSSNVVDIEISGDTLFALMQRYVYDAETYSTTYPLGVIGIYDAEKGDLLDSIQLLTQNPTAMKFYDGALYVASQGPYNDSWGTDADSLRGIEKVDVAALTSEIVVSGEDLGGGVYQFALDTGDGLAYAAIYKSYGDVPLVKVDLATGKVSTVSGVSDVEGSLAYDSASGLLYIGDRTYGSEAVYVYDGASVSEIDIGTALAPYSIAAF